MTNLPKLGLGLACLLVAGCSSETAEDPLAFGSAVGAAARNGLPYATEATSKTDFDGTVVTVRLLTQRHVLADGTVDVVARDTTFEPETVTAGGVVSGYITIEGERIRMTSTATPDSTGVNWWTQTYQVGDFANLVGVYTYALPEDGFGNDPEAEGAADYDAYFIVGFETNPGEVAALSGSVTYAGGFAAYGNVLDGERNILVRGAESFGDASLIAQFGSGLVVLEFSGEIPGFGSFTAASDGMAIDGNGFTGTLHFPVCPEGTTCTSDSRIGGVFYGPDAATAGGLIHFDAVAVTEDTGATVILDHAGGFVVDRED